jgi:hypothetical protein
LFSEPPRGVISRRAALQVLVKLKSSGKIDNSVTVELARRLLVQPPQSRGG